MNGEGAVRVRLDLGYDGTAFSGWARQPGLRTVQGELEAVIATLLHTREDPPVLRVAGRTDVGVHAIGQVAHLDLDPTQAARAAGSRRPGGVENLAGRINGALGQRRDIQIHRTGVAPEGFDARFSAVWRRYEYRIADEAAVRDPRRRGHTLWYPAALDAEAMNGAAELLLGLHDFASFCRPREGATTIRELQAFRWDRDGDGVLVARLQADAFCHSMVRALVGACVAAGEGRIPPDRVDALRAAEERTSEFKVLPAHGLTLTEVGYPPEPELAARADATRARRDAD